MDADELTRDDLRALARRLARQSRESREIDPNDRATAYALPFEQRRDLCFMMGEEWLSPAAIDTEARRIAREAAEAATPLVPADAEFGLVLARMTIVSRRTRQAMPDVRASLHASYAPFRAELARTQRRNDARMLRARTRTVTRPAFRPAVHKRASRGRPGVRRRVRPPNSTDSEPAPARGRRTVSTALDQPGLEFGLRRRDGLWQRLELAFGLAERRVA